MKRQSGKIKIFVIDDNRLDGVGWWRNSEPFAALDKLYGQYLEIRNASENIDIRELKTADIVVRFRPTSKESLTFLEVCKDFGIKVLLDIDDDLWNVPLGHPVYMDSLDFGKQLRQIYSLADTVWTSTEQLRYSVGDLGLCEVMPNAVLPEQLPDKPMEWKGNGIAAWRGSGSQLADITAPFVRAWYENWRDKYDRWIFAGYAPDLPHGENVQFRRGVSPLLYFLGLRNGLANVFWKPLQENLFNDAKSNIAWIEATLSGGVCVTNYAGHDGWENAMPEFSTDPDEVVTVWQQSKEHILDKYNLLKITERRFESIVKLLDK